MMTFIVHSVKPNLDETRATITTIDETGGTAKLFQIQTSATKFKHKTVNVPNQIQDVAAYM